MERNNPRPSEESDGSILSDAHLQHTCTFFSQLNGSTDGTDREAPRSTYPVKQRELERRPTVGVGRCPMHDA